MKPETTRHETTQKPTSFFADLAIYLLVFVLIGFGAVSSSKFLIPTELMGTVQQVALLGIVASGVMFVTYSGHYADLSVPTIMALSGIVAISTLGLGLIPAILIAVGAGMAIGLVNGWVIGYLRVNPIIWTLVTAAAGIGFIQLALHNTQTYSGDKSIAGQAFEDLFGKVIFGVPLIVIVLMVLIVTGQLILSKTKFSAQLRLVGSSYEVARMTGVNVRLRTLQAFFLSAFTAALGGVFLASLNKVGADYLGKGYDFRAVTAVVLGGVSLAGGRGNMVGVLGGVIAIGLIEKVLSIMEVSVDYQEVAKGLLFITVVGVSAYLMRRKGADDA